MNVIVHVLYDITAIFGLGCVLNAPIQCCKISHCAIDVVYACDMSDILCRQATFMVGYYMAGFAYGQITKLNFV